MIDYYLSAADEAGMLTLTAQVGDGTAKGLKIAMIGTPA